MCAFNSFQRTSHCYLINVTLEIVPIIYFIIFCSFLFYTVRVIVRFMSRSYLFINTFWLLGCYVLDVTILSLGYSSNLFGRFA